MEREVKIDYLKDAIVALAELSPRAVGFTHDDIEKEVWAYLNDHNVSKKEALLHVLADISQSPDGAAKCIDHAISDLVAAIATHAQIIQIELSAQWGGLAPKFRPSSNANGP